MRIPLGFLINRALGLDENSTEKDYDLALAALKYDKRYRNKFDQLLAEIQKPENLERLIAEFKARK